MTKTAVVTGGAQGIGRAIAEKLLIEGYDTAICDVNREALMASAKDLGNQYPVNKTLPIICDVSDRADVKRMRDSILHQLGTTKIEVLVNNAGIVGGASFFTSDEAQWDSTFNVCWKGVYNCAREFLPCLVTAEEAHLVNVCSANGFWASSHQETPLSAYSTAKFAVKGFTESLIVDAKRNAKHVHPMLVMLGQVSTHLAGNSARYLGLTSPLSMSDEELERIQATTIDPMRSMTVEDFREALHQSMFGVNRAAPTTPEQAAEEIWQAIEAKQWRVVIGIGAKLLDEEVRRSPEAAYRTGFIDGLITKRDKAIETRE